MKIDIVPPPRPRAAPPMPGLSPAWLAHAPHRLMFFVGAGNVLLAMLWWVFALNYARS